MSDVPILEETDRTTGRDALRKNIQAAMALAGAVRSTLGPKGLDKLLVDDEGRSMVTNDGITVLESAKVEHPIAHMLIAASAAQDQPLRDGTTSTVLLAAEWLQNDMASRRTRCSSCNDCSWLSNGRGVLQGTFGFPRIRGEP